MYVSIGIIAWNEADSIGTLLRSLFAQSLFRNLRQEGHGVEILVAANGCSDGTERIAESLLRSLHSAHPDASIIRYEVVSLKERGKLNAWNRYVHSLSSKACQFMFLMDADIELEGIDTLWSMLRALRDSSSAKVCVGIPVKIFRSKTGAGLGSTLSRRSSQITASSPGQITGQLYCIRSETARNIYLPKDLAACDDGFIKALVCTDCLTAPLNTGRVCLASNAHHLFEAYTSPIAVLRNQKRQIIGQTIVHILIDQHLPTLPLEQRKHLSETLERADVHDPDWLKRLIARHVSKSLPWRLYPSLLTHRLRRVWKLPAAQRITCLPAALAHMGILTWASVLAYWALKKGSTDYWPKAGRKTPRGNYTLESQEPNPPSKQQLLANQIVSHL